MLLKRQIERSSKGHTLVTKPPSGAACDNALHGEWFSICMDVAEYFLIPPGHTAGGNLRTGAESDSAQCECVQASVVHAP